MDIEKKTTTQGISKEIKKVLFKSGTLLEDRYLLQEFLGMGGMGVVYKAIDLFDQKTVAIKFFFSNDMEMEIVLKKIQSLHSEYLVHIFYFGQSERYSFLVMEYVKGKELSLVDLSIISPSKKTYLIKKIMEGIKVLHINGILHLDLKPANVLIGDKGEIKLTDFSISETIKILADPPGKKRGTPSFMAPEQLKGKELSESSDIYSLGILIHYIFTGQLYGCESLFSLLPHKWRRIVRKAVRENPAKRFQNIQEIERELASGIKRNFLWILVFFFVVLAGVISFFFLDREPVQFSISNGWIDLYNTKSIKVCSLRHPDTAYLNEFKGYRVVLSDINGDSHNELIVLSKSGYENEKEPMLLVFNHKGKLLWKEKFRQIYTMESEETYLPPFILGSIHVKDLDNNGLLEILIVGHSTFAPSFMILYNSNGKKISEFVNMGHINREGTNLLFQQEEASRKWEVFAGATNNEYHQAILVGLYPFQMDGKSPQEKPDKNFKNLPVAPVKEYIRFPRTLLSTKEESMPVNIKEITKELIGFRIQVEEINSRKIREMVKIDDPAASYYFFDQEFRLTSIGFNNEFYIAFEYFGFSIDLDREKIRLAENIMRWNGKSWERIAISPKSAISRLMEKAYNRNIISPK